MTDSSRPYNYAPVPAESYIASRLGANVSGLKRFEFCENMFLSIFNFSNREYRFRLVGSAATGEIIRSECTVFRTHKDRYENAAYYQNYQGATEKERVSHDKFEQIYGHF
jgi:hypothetical protein